MTYTEEDLRAAFGEVAATAASAEDVLHRLQVTDSIRRPRRRGYLLVAATCLVVAAVATSAILVTGHVRNQTRPAATSPVKMALGPRFTFSFRMGDLPPGYAVASQQIEQGFQWAEIGRKQPAGCDRAPQPPGLDCGLGESSYYADDGYLVYAAVFVLDSGQFDPSAMKGATPVDVNGARGLLADTPPPSRTLERWSPAIAEGHPTRLTTLAWPYAPDSWAVIAWRNDTDPGARDLLLTLGRATKIGGTHRALVPFSVGYLPAAVDRRDELEVSVGAHYVGAGFSSRHSHVLSISASARALSDPDMPARDERPLTVGGRQARYSPSLAYLSVTCGAQCTLTISSTQLSEAQLITIAQNITPARSITNTSTWFDAATALPH
jgi:hypothetical protein